MGKRSENISSNNTYIHTANNHIKIFNIIVIKNTVKYHFIPTRITTIKKSGDSKYW